MKMPNNLKKILKKKWLQTHNGKKKKDSKFFTRKRADKMRNL